MNGSDCCNSKEVKYEGILTALYRLDNAVAKLSGLMRRVAEGSVPEIAEESKVDRPSGEMSLAQFLSSTKGRIDEQVSGINEKVKELENALF